MAHVLRLILALWLALAGVAAWAVIPATSGTLYRATAAYAWTSDAAGACTVYIADQSNASSTFIITFVSVSAANQCYAKYVRRSDGGVQNANTIIITLQTQAGLVCPANSTLSGSTCQCASGYVENAAQTACELPPDPCAALAGKSAGEWWKDVGCASSGGALDCSKPAARSFTACDTKSGVGGGKCLVAVRNGTATDLTGNGWWQIQGEGYYTGGRAPGGNCSGLGGPSGEPPPATPQNPSAPPENPASPTPGEPAPAPCPEGQAPGAVNGVTACYPTGGDKPTVTDAPGNGESTVNKPDGSSTTTSQSGSTTCKAGTCTTTTNNTTVITNKPGDTNCPAGTTVGSTTKDGQTVTTCTSSSTSTSTGTQAGFCKDNPSSKQCGQGQGGAFGGTCAAGFKAVSEDAVLNAMAEEQYRRNCQFFEKKPDDTEESLAYEDMKAKGKAGVDQTNDLPAASKREVSIGPGDFDSSNALGGAACITDRTIVVMGRSISLPFSQLCVWLGYMGTVLLACSYLVAARIVMGAK